MFKFWKNRRNANSKIAQRAHAEKRHLRFEMLETRQLLSASGDFNGDGITDLAVGSPGMTLGSATGAGAVSVIYGQNGTGLATTNNQVWSMSRPGMVGGTQAGDAFGSALAVGDFNGDGYADLAVGLPGRNAIVPLGTPGSTPTVIGGTRVGVIKSVGAISIIYGSQNGLIPTNNQFFTQTSLFPLTTLVAGSEFGYSLTTGDFNGDGYTDLAISAPFMTVNGLQKAGAVYVMFGSATGLKSSGADLITQGSGGILGTASRGAAFGQALTTADFNVDGYSDLAIGAPTAPRGGSVNVIYGGTTGLSSSGNQIWAPGTGGIKLVANVSDEFGWSLAAGDFNGDFVPDLAIGAPGSFVGKVSAGAVSILFGSLDLTGLTSKNNALLTRASLGSTSAAGDQFGYSLAAGYFNGDAYEDLAIGTPFADINGATDAGMVQLVYGSSTGPTVTGTVTLTEATPTAGYNFGTSITTGDYNGDGYYDISVGIPHQSFGTLANVGAVQTDYGSTTGIVKKNQQLWRFGLLGLQGTATAGSAFGSSAS